jgi:16S rRNA (cytosine967-C5)-methyltransferase
LLKPGGRLIYITCSVFAAENEDQREWLQENGLQLLDEQLFQGSTENSDTLYRVVLRAT